MSECGALDKAPALIRWWGQGERTAPNRQIGCDGGLAPPFAIGHGVGRRTPWRGDADVDAAALVPATRLRRTLPCQKLHPNGSPDRIGVGGAAAVGALTICLPTGSLCILFFTMKSLTKFTVSASMLTDAFCCFAALTNLFMCLCLSITFKALTTSCSPIL